MPSECLSCVLHCLSWQILHINTRQHADVAHLKIFLKSQLSWFDDTSRYGEICWITREESVIKFEIYSVWAMCEQLFLCLSAFVLERSTHVLYMKQGMVLCNIQMFNLLLLAHACLLSMNAECGSGQKRRWWWWGQMVRFLLWARIHATGFVFVGQRTGRLQMPFPRVKSWPPGSFYQTSLTFV